MMAAYIDEFKDRFRVGPICRVLAASLDCGLVTPRGYRMFKSRPVSRMAARHEALARDILEIHADFFMAVYGYRKTHARLLARGWDPAEIGRDQVMNVMRCFASIFLKQFLHYFSAVWAAGFQQELHHMTAQTRTGTGPPCLYIPET